MNKTKPERLIIQYYDQVRLVEMSQVSITIIKIIKT